MRSELDAKALDAAWKTVSGMGYQHLEPLVTDAIRAYLAALPQAEPGWRPIESAPRDGTRIIGWCVHDTDPYHDDEAGKLTDYGCWVEALGRVQDGPHILVWGGSDSDYDEWSDKTISWPDWWFRDGSEFEEAANPTHWMPLPTAPTPAIEEGRSDV